MGTPGLTDTVPPPAPRILSRGQAAWPVVAVVLAGLALSAAAMAYRPDRYLTSEFLFGDQSVNLLLADDLLAGQRLYRDTFSQYGPIPAYLYAAFAGAFGNTPASFLAFHQALSLLTLGLIAYLLARATRPATALFVAAAGVLPIFLTPGGLLGSYTSAAYIPLERLCLVLLAVTWAPPQCRGWKQAAALGVILGSWQGVKFGGAFYAGLALLLVDLLAVALARPPSLRPWLGGLAVTGLAFLFVEACWAALAFAALPWPVAADALWPQYMLVQYDSLQASPTPVWGGWSYFLGQQLTPLVGVGLGVAALAGYIVAAWRGRRGAAHDIALAPLGLFIPLLFWLLGFAGYFRHAHLPLQYVWAACLAAALLVDRLPRWAWLVLALCWLPGLALVVKAAAVSRPPASLTATRMPTGDVLYLTGDERALIEGISAELGRGEDTDRRCVLFFPCGAGMHHFFNIPRSGRHAWYLSGFIRPYEEAKTIQNLDRVRALVFVQAPTDGDGAGDPVDQFNAVFHRPVFGGAVGDALRARLHDPVRVGPACVVYRLR